MTAVCLLILLSQWVSAFPAELDIAFAKVTKGENTAGCLIVWEYAVKNVYCQYDLMFSKKRKKSVSIEHSFWMDGSIQLTRYTETFSLINAIRKWLKILYPNLKIARNTPQRLGQLITGLKNESRSKIIFETQKRDIYHIEIHNNKNNPYAKTQPKKQFSWLVHTAIAKKSPLQKRSYAQIIAEKKLAVTEKLIVSEKKLTLTEDIPKEHKVQSIFIADFEIAFAKLANNKNTAGCLIVWEKYVVSSKKHIYCRYELNKIRDFLTDPKYGINLLNVFVFHSKDHVDFQSEIKYWLTSKYPHLTLDLNNQYISKLENIISNPSMIFNSIHFAGKKRDIYRLSIQSNKNNPYKHHSDKQLAWLVHTTIAQKLTQPQNKVQVKKDIQLDIQPTKKEFKTEEHSHTLIVIISWVRDLIILIVCVILAFILIKTLIKKYHQTTTSQVSPKSSRPFLKLLTLNQLVGVTLKERTDIINVSHVSHYCQKCLANKQQKNGLERVLVYNLRAGTLELSLMQITWHHARKFPEKLRIEHHLEVPIAGNYLDRLLARLVDHHLRAQKIAHPKSFHYHYPIVAISEEDNAIDTIKQRRATTRLWQHIRDSKHQWDGKMPFRVKIGAPNTIGLIDYFGRIQQNKRYQTFIEHSKLGYFLNIPSYEVHEYPLIKDFMTFITENLLDTLLEGAGLKTQDINTVLISGNDALWPNLQERVETKFPKAGHHFNNNPLKSTMTWKNISHIQTPHLAILCDDTNILVLEQDWNKMGGIDLRGNSTFCLVQIAHHLPNSKTDFNSLQSYLHLPLKQYYRHWHWEDNPYLFVTRKGNIITLLNTHNQGFKFEYRAMSSYLTASPPWAIGENGVLPKQDFYY